MESQHEIATSPEFRQMIEELVCASDRFKPKYQHLDTPNTIERFNQVANSDMRAVLVLASRPFSNINYLRKAEEDISHLEKVKTTVEYCGLCGLFGTENRTIKCYDQEKLSKIRNTFNGPALIPNLLPPPDYLMGKLGHPSLQGNKAECWKNVCGKLEAISDPLPAFFFEKADQTKAQEKALSKKEFRREEERQSQVADYISNFVLVQLKTFEGAGQYPGGPEALTKRCFSVYTVKFNREKIEEGIINYGVRWVDDYTHKHGSWSKKSSRVTVPLPRYRVVQLPNQPSIAAFDDASYCEQLKELVDDK